MVIPGCAPTASLRCMAPPPATMNAWRTPRAARASMIQSTTRTELSCSKAGALDLNRSSSFSQGHPGEADRAAIMVHQPHHHRFPHFISTESHTATASG